MNPRDSDFDSMESRPGGGGAGVVVWLLVLLFVSIVAVGVALVLETAPVILEMARRLT